MITILKPEEQHQHLNGGGWVANTAKVADTAYIGSNAQVYGNAQVSGNARVYGNAQVSGNARVYDKARVFGNAQVSGDAQVCGDARVYGNVQVYDGNARVYDKARVFGNAQVSGDAQVSGGAWETSPLYIQGTRHALTNSSYGFLNIGCIKLSFSEWKKKYRAVGKQQGYTVEQIKEYGTIIAFATKLGKKEKHGK